MRLAVVLLVSESLTDSVAPTAIDTNTTGKNNAQTALQHVEACEVTSGEFSYVTRNKKELPDDDGLYSSLISFV